MEETRSPPERVLAVHWLLSLALCEQRDVGGKHLHSVQRVFVSVAQGGVTPHAASMSVGSGPGMSGVSYLSPVVGRPHPPLSSVQSGRVGSKLRLL